MDMQNNESDYGIDIDLELFEYENGSCITLGEHLFFYVHISAIPFLITG